MACTHKRAVNPRTEEVKRSLNEDEQRWRIRMKQFLYRSVKKCVVVVVVVVVAIFCFVDRSHLGRLALSHITLPCRSSRGRA